MPKGTYADVDLILLVRIHLDGCFGNKFHLEAVVGAIVFLKARGFFYCG